MKTSLSLVLATMHLDFLEIGDHQLEKCQPLQQVLHGGAEHFVTVILKPVCGMTLEDCLMARSRIGIGHLLRSASPDPQSEVLVIVSATLIQVGFAGEVGQVPWAPAPRNTRFDFVATMPPKFSPSRSEVSLTHDSMLSAHLTTDPCDKRSQQHVLMAEAQRAVAR